MRFNHSDLFVKFLTSKAHGSWSSSEVIDIFKHRYGQNYEVALANFLMDSLETHTTPPKKTKLDRSYEGEWRRVLSK